MATSSSTPADKSPYLSFKELKYEDIPVFFSSAAKRLYWPFDGEFPEIISVMETPQSGVGLVPFFRPGAEGIDDTWHEISEQPLTEPKCSSIEVYVRELHDWESNWLEFHERHAGTGHDPSSGYILYGDMSDEDRPYAKEMKEDGSWEEDSDTEFLIRCCGQDRPLRKRDIKMSVTPSAGRDFVTVYDYVSTVHPWLMSLRQEILCAKQAELFDLSNPSLSTEWMVIVGPELFLEEKQGWLRRHGGGTSSKINPATDRVVARILAQRAQARANGTKW